jgi:hypothetical protein
MASIVLEWYSGLMPVPARPKVYHITPVSKLPRIIADGVLLSDATIIARGTVGVQVGMGNIKQARLQRPVDCHQGLMVGGCVPFYFCSRSVMLYLLHKSNHPELDWADQNEHRWAFTLSNARSGYAEFRDDLANLADVDWESVATNSWSGNGISSDVKENKQAEFLVENSFPWSLVTRIGVLSRKIYGEVHDVLAKTEHKPKVEIRPDWYY